MRRNKLFGWLTGFASVAMAAGTSMAPVLAAVSENTPGGGNPGPVEEVVDGGDENLNAAGQEEPADEDVGRIAGEGETEESKANGETGKNLDGAIAHRASGEDGDTEASGVYEFKDNKTTGTVTVVKKWDDQSNNAERPVVDVNLSTAKPSKNPLGYTVTFHADVEKGLTFADGSIKNEVVYNSSGQVVSGTYQGLTGGSGVVRWYTDKTYQTPVGLNADGTLTAPLTGDVDVWPKKVTFEVKKGNIFHTLIPDTIDTVVFTDEKRPINSTIVDVDADGDGGVIAWIEDDRETTMKISSQIQGIKVEAAKDSSYMFYQKTKIQTILFTNFDTSSVTNMAAFFYGCSKLKSTDFSTWDTDNVTNMQEMFCGCSSFVDLDLTALKTNKVTSLHGFLHGCTNLVNLDVSILTTENVKDMGNMFYNCLRLTQIDLSSWDTGQVTNMKSMFQGCAYLVQLNISSIDTKNVTNMSYMFVGCYRLTSMDISQFNTSNVTTMSHMFNGCSSILRLDCEKWDVSEVLYMDYMFGSCYKLITLNLSAWNTENVVNMEAMFQSCRALTNLNLGNVKTSKVTQMGSMFRDCQSLTSIDLSSFVTNKVATFGCMFYCCYALTTLNLSSFVVNDTAGMNLFFGDCNNLKTLIIGQNFQFINDCSLSGTWQNTAGKTFTSDNFPSNVSDTYTRIS